MPTKRLSSFHIAVVVMLVLVAGRSLFALGDFSYFFVAGSDFTDAQHTPIPVFVQNGQGYDGQFFYRLALDPFDFSKTRHGVTLDFPAYRAQRICYPLLSWLISFGGTPGMVPFALLFVNVCAYLGMVVCFRKWIALEGLPAGFQWAPLLLCGVLMSVARDLSEVTEVFFFSLMLLAYKKQQAWLVAAAAALALLSRETFLLIYIPMAVAWLVAREGKVRLVHVAIPLAVFAAWKFFIMMQTGGSSLVAGAGNLGIPFKGMVSGFRQNLLFDSLKHQLQFVFWVAYFAWQLSLVLLVLRQLRGRAPVPDQPIRKSLLWAWVAFGIFACCLSDAIYIDDWSFVRVFSLWNLCGLAVLAFSAPGMPRFFRSFSWLLVALTVGRLIVRA